MNHIAKSLIRMLLEITLWGSVVMETRFPFSKPKVLLVWTMVLAGFLSARPANADLVFEVAYSADANSQLNSAQKLRIEQGMQFWDDVIVGHQDDLSRTWTLNVEVFDEGPTETGQLRVGWGVPATAEYSGIVDGVTVNGGRYALSTEGTIRFNIHEAAASYALNDLVIRHEIAHALGFGTLWTHNGLYDENDPGKYRGKYGVAAFKREFLSGLDASEIDYIPVELHGGPGTAHAHWDEDDEYGRHMTDLFDLDGRNSRDELMTGWAPPNFSDVFLSETTRESFRDLGFTVTPAVPEPSSVPCLSSILMVAVAFIRRRKDR